MSDYFLDTFTLTLGGRLKKNDSLFFYFKDEISVTQSNKIKTFSFILYLFLMSWHLI